MKKFKVTRRGFLKATGALGVLALEESQIGLLRQMGGVAEAVAAPAEEEEEVHMTLCPGCGPYSTGCGQLAHVKDGRITNIEGWLDFPSNLGTQCAKGNSMLQWIYSPQRLRYPMKRVGEKGEGKFKRITWDEALETVSSKLLEIKQKYGPESFFTMRGIFTAGGVAGNLQGRFCSAFGSPNASGGARETCSNPKGLTYKLVTGRSGSADYANTSLMVNWGNNPGVSSAAQGHIRRILDAKERGAKLIVINPEMNHVASRADIWVPVRPGTDTALALAMINVAINENLYDADFVSQWCYGFDELKEHIQKYTPEWAEPIIGVSADMIREVTRLYMTTKPACLTIGNAFDQWGPDTSNGTRAVAMLVALSGNLDRRGGNIWGVSMGGKRPKNPSALREKLSPEMVAKGVGVPEFPLWFDKIKTMYCTHYLLREAIITGKPYPVKALLIQGHNPVVTQRNPARVSEALKKLEFMVVFDICKTPSCDYADIVLPAATIYETDSMHMTSGPSVYSRNKVIEPLGESRHEWQVLFDLAVKMGMGADFWGGDMDACLNECLEPTGVTIEELRKHPEGIIIRTPAPPMVYEKYEKYFKSLPEGKVQLYGKLYEEYGYNPLPVYHGQPESHYTTPELVDKYPLAMYDPHADEISHHSWMRHLPWPREINRYPWLKIHPMTAEERGIKEGDWVKIESPHGWIKAVAWIFPGIRPDTVCGKHGWWQGCDELGLPQYGVFNGGVNTSVLYADGLVEHDPVTATVTKHTLVQISKTTPPIKMTAAEVEA